MERPLGNVTDEQVVAWYRSEILPGMRKLAYQDWWRIVRLIHRGKSLFHVQALEAADRLFMRNKFYNLAMRAWAMRDVGCDVRDISLRESPKPLVEHRMRKVGMRAPWTPKVDTHASANG